MAKSKKTESTVSVTLSAGQILIQNAETGKATIVSEKHYRNEQKKGKKSLYFGWDDVSTSASTAPAPTV